MYLVHGGQPGEYNRYTTHLSHPQTRYFRESCTGPDIEAQDKAENMSRREGADQLF